MKRSIQASLIALICSTILCSCSNDDEGSKTSGTYTDDRDGNTYSWAKIGDQVWMTENLRYLPTVEEPTTGSFTIPYYYVYGYNGQDIEEAKASANYTSFGVLYNWVAAENACPTGWHLPTDDEWTQLLDFVGGDAGKLKEIGSSYWGSPNEASNETGFSARGGGYRSSTGSFIGIGAYGFWWSSTETVSDKVLYRRISFNSTEMFTGDFTKDYGFCVRCIKN